MKLISCWSFYSENYEKGVFDTITKSWIHETLHILWQSRKKNTIDPNQKKFKKKYRCESQWFTKTTDHGTLRTAFQTLQLISDNEQKDDGNIREKFMMREDREIIEQ